jgi:PQQ-like domain/Protein of unknown function (DUF1214)
MKMRCADFCDQKFTENFATHSLIDLAGAPTHLAFETVAKADPNPSRLRQRISRSQLGYGAREHTYTKGQIGQRYLFTGVRILINPADPQEFKQVHALQDAVKVTQPCGPGRLEVPNWDHANQKKVRDTLLVLNETGGRKDEVDPVRHLIGTAPAWGLNPDKDAIYLNVTPSKNDGATTYKLNVPGDVPVDALWSIIVYDATGHLQKNRYDAYSLNIAPPPGGEIYGHLDARDPVTGDKKWEVRFPGPPLASVLSTVGNLVFVPDSRGVIHAYDAETGTELWNHFDGTGHQGGIISYAVGGKQYIAATAGFGRMASDDYAPTFGGVYKSMPRDDVAEDLAPRAALSNRPNRTPPTAGHRFDRQRPGFRGIA